MDPGTVKDKPVQVTAVLAVLLFWLLTPLVAQKYFGYSAVNVSFIVTVVYFVCWKLYMHREKIRGMLNI